MKNVAKYYTSIGLLEDLDNTLKVFQAVLPRWAETWKQVRISCFVIKNLDKV